MAENPNNIKEKLNLHVKRRLQETDDASFQHIEENSLASQESTPSTSKLKVKKSGTKTKKSKVVKDEDSLSNNPDKDEEPGESCNPSKEKQPKVPCVLDMILNSKKLALMRDPEIVAIIRNLSEEVNKSVYSFKT